MSNADDASRTTAKPSTAATVTAEPAKPRTQPAPATAARKLGGTVEEERPTNKLRRRIVWSCIWGYLAANFLMFLRFFFPRTLFEPSTTCALGYASDFQLGVNEQYKQKCRLWVVKEPTRLFCIFAKCTHLGCTPNWVAAENKFKCPCHGSGYTPEGINIEGPAPRPMDRAHVELDAEGRVIADTSRLYSWFKSTGGADHFNDPGAYIPLV